MQKVCNKFIVHAMLIHTPLKRHNITHIFLSPPTKTTQAESIVLTPHGFESNPVKPSTHWHTHCFRPFQKSYPTPHLGTLIILKLAINQYLDRLKGPGTNILSNLSIIPKNTFSCDQKTPKTQTSTAWANLPNSSWHPNVATAVPVAQLHGVSPFCSLPRGRASGNKKTRR